MEIDINALPTATELLKKIIVDLQKELLFYKEKYFFLLEQVRLARLRCFASSSEKNIYFDPTNNTLTENKNTQAMLSSETQSVPNVDLMEKKHPGGR